MEKTEYLGESDIPWVEGELSSKVSTSLPEIIAEETAVGTLVIIIISAIISITLLFVVGVFIDCRHQKLTQKKQLSSTRTFLRIPRFGRSSSKEDKSSLAANIHPEDVSSPPITVIV